MRGAFGLLLTIALTLPSAASADLQSTIGGKPLTQDMVHSGGVGWPSLRYEWWNAGRGALDWGLGTSLVYGDWAGAFSDVDVGASFYAPLRWHLKRGIRPKTTIDTALRFTPGALIGQIGGRQNIFVVGVKAELTIPVSIKVHERVNVVTGAAIPASVLFPESPGNIVTVLPILIRMGVEVDAGPKTSPWFLLELGPGIGISDGVADTDFAFRIWVGTTFWSVLGGG